MLICSGSCQPDAHRADPRARVEHDHRAVGERDLHARGVAAVAVRLRSRRRHRPPRSPHVHLHRSESSQKKTIAPRWSPVATIGIALASIRRSMPSQERMWKRECPARPRLSPLVRSSVAERDRLAVVVERAVLAPPFLRGHRPGLLEAPSQQLPGRLVVEGDHPAVVHEQSGGREAREEVPREDQLQRPLSALHPLNPIGETNLRPRRYCARAARGLRWRRNGDPGRSDDRASDRHREHGGSEPRARARPAGGAARP